MSASAHEIDATSEPAIGLILSGHSRPGSVAMPETADAPRGLASDGPRVEASSPPPSHHDAALEEKLRGWMVAIVRRDEAAFDQLYTAVVNRAWSVAMRIVRQPEAAEEVVEDCFWQVWREAERFDAARGRVLTWLLTICRSRALDYLRRKDIAEPTDDIDSFRSGELADDRDPLDILGATERASAVHRALEQLKPKERQLISLAFFRGLTHQEIADACAMPIGTVKTNMHKAFKQLQVILGGQGWDVPE